MLHHSAVGKRKNLQKKNNSAKVGVIRIGFEGELVSDRQCYFIVAPILFFGLIHIGLRDKSKEKWELF